MRARAYALASVAAFAAATACAEETRLAGRRLTHPPNPAWDFGITVYPTIVRGGDDYTAAIAVADRGPLHLEARIDYEDRGARSAFVGWTFSGGDAVEWEVTPIVGGAWGSLSAFIPGVEASFAWRRFDIYVEAEYVHDTNEADDRYLYAWNEFGWRPAEWVRLGLAGQRTRAYGGERDYLGGPFVQFSIGPVTLGGYWFNPGASDQVFVGSIGATF